MGKNSFKLPDPRPADSVTDTEAAILSRYIAPALSGGNGNADIGRSVLLADALDEIPLFQGLQLAALVGGGGPDAGAWADEMTAERLIGTGAQPGQQYFFHLKFPRAKTKNEHNVAGLLLHFDQGWEAGLSSLLSELGYDGNSYLNVISEVPAVIAATKEAAKDIFGSFQAPPPPKFDPFAIPDGPFARPRD